MFSSLSSLFDDLAERLHNEKYKNVKSDLEYVTVNDGSLILKLQDCNKNYEKSLMRI